MVQLGKHCIIVTAHVHGPRGRILLSCEGVCEWSTCLGFLLL